MQPIRVKVCQESDLRMLGDLARNIQRVLPVTQADIDAAAALGEGWVVWKVFEVNDPLDNLRGGTQLVIKQNSITPGQNVRRVIFVSGPGGVTAVIGPAPAPLLLPDAVAHSLSYIKAFGGTQQTGTPTPTVPLDIVCNNGTLKFLDDELPEEYRRVLGYSCDNDTLWEITGFHLMGSDIVRISFSVTGACNVFGCYQGASALDNYDLYVSTSAGAKYLRYGNGTYLSYWSPDNLGQRFDVVFSPTGTTGMPQDSTWTPSTFTSENDLLIAATTLTGTSAKLKGELYGNFVVDGRLKLIPCERVSDGVLGYYDTYTQTFFEPTGTPTSLGYDGSHRSLTIVGLQEKINAYSENRIDLHACTDGKYYNGSGVYATSVDGKLTDFIPIKNGQKVTFYAKYIAGTPNVRFNIFDSDQVWLSQTAITLNAGNPEVAYVITPTQDGFLRISANRQGSSCIDWSVSQLVDGEYTLATMPDFTVNGGTAKCENLFSVGTYTDVQSILNGVITRNVGIKILNGTENWVTGTGGVWYNFQGDVGAFDTSAMICSHYSYAGSNISIANLTQNKFSSLLNGNIAFKSAETTSASAFKTWLASQYAIGTPVIIIYPKATPTTENVASQTVQVQEGNNTIAITQASMTGLELEAQYTKSV